MGAYSDKFQEPARRDSGGGRVMASTANDSRALDGYARFATLAADTSAMPTGGCAGSSRERRARWARWMGMDHSTVLISLGTSRGAGREPRQVFTESLALCQA
jgi:hypothetical protein